MRILVIGPGRIGMALARCARNAGHEVTLLARSGSRSSDIARREGFWVFTRKVEEGEAEPGPEIDLMLFTAAPENPARFGEPDALKAAFGSLGRQSPGVPLASIAGSLDLAALSNLFGERPLARFFCSAAVADPASTRFYDDLSHPDAVRLLKQALPGQSWTSVAPEAFPRYGALLTAAALACVPLIELTRELGTLSGDEQRFLAGTLDEARRLIDAHGGDATAAYASALTPGGMTRRFSEHMFRRAPLGEPSDRGPEGVA